MGWRTPQQAEQIRDTIDQFFIMKRDLVQTGKWEERVRNIIRKRQEYAWNYSNGQPSQQTQYHYLLARAAAVAKQDRRRIYLNGHLLTKDAAKAM